jgi:hypothetical protein
MIGREQLMQLSASEGGSTMFVSCPRIRWERLMEITRSLKSSYYSPRTIPRVSMKCWFLPHVVVRTGRLERDFPCFSLSCKAIPVTGREGP